MNLLPHCALLEHYTKTSYRYVIEMSFQIGEYKMSSMPRGVCLIINNRNFIKMGNRSGSDKDEGVWFY